MSASVALRLVAAACLLLGALRATADSVDDYVRAEMRNQRLPGVALAIVRNGRPADVRTFGIANVETAAPVTRDTVFRVASVSKQFIATGILLLVEDGKLSLDDSLRRFIDETPPSWQPITIRHLLTHTSGLPRESPNFEPFAIQPNIELLRKAYGSPLTATPGERFGYSNLGYYVLAEIITRASGEHWSAFLHKRIFEPLRMNATRETSLIDVVPNRANGYIYRDGVLRNAPPLLAARPSGGLLSSIADLVKWDAAQTTAKLLRQESQVELWTSARLADGTPTNYGFGWWIDDVAGHRRLRHGGDNPGFNAEYTRFPDDGVSVIVLVNGSSARPAAMAVEVAGRYIRGLRANRKTVALDTATLAAYAGRYEIAPQNILSIGVDHGGLSVQSSAGGSQYKLVAETRDTFFITPDESYRFVLQDGAVTDLVIGSGPDLIHAKRMP